MSLIVRANYNLVKQYKNKTVRATYNGKKHNVFFRLVCDDFDINDCIELAKNNSNVLMLDYQGIEGVEVNADVYVGKTYDAGSDINEGDIQSILDQTPKGMVAIIKLPEGFNDLELIWRLSKKFKNVRFCGGKLFSALGCNIGCCGVDVLDKKNIKHSESSFIKEGCCCAFTVVDSSEVELEVGAVKASQPKKPKVMFSDLLYRNGKVSL